MKRTLRVLVAEDSPDDCELLLMELARDYELVHQRVDSRDAMVQALENAAWDLILCDWSMPQFSALEALGLLRERALDVPCIIASGTIGEEVAVEALRNGARDFLIKDQLARLRPAVDRELHETAMRHERNKMRQQLMVSDRLASVGMLAAGLAHEINNPLAAVMSNVEIALHDLRARRGDIGDALEALDDAYAAAGRIRDIMRDLKLFSRGADESRRNLDVTTLVRSALRMAQNEIRHRAMLRVDLGRVPQVEANESRLSQVILNLVLNAAQSISEGRADQNEIRVTTALDEQDRVVISVSDTGCGIAPADHERVFEPFFTTSSTGTGMGLGLSICHHIVADLGGEITLDSAVGRGSTFCVHLPAATRPSPVMIEPVASATATRTGLRILVIDDDAIVARGLERALRDSHDVEVANHAAHALDAIRKGERYDVILCDVMMPGMTGREVYDRIRTGHPGLERRIVLVTGGAFVPRLAEFLESVDNPKLLKPFTEDQVLAAIADAARR